MQNFGCFLCVLGDAAGKKLVPMTLPLVYEPVIDLNLAQPCLITKLLFFVLRRVWPMEVLLPPILELIYSTRWKLWYLLPSLEILLQPAYSVSKIDREVWLHRALLLDCEHTLLLLPRLIVGRPVSAKFEQLLFKIVARGFKRFVESLKFSLKNLKKVTKRGQLYWNCLYNLKVNQVNL